MSESAVYYFEDMEVGQLREFSDPYEVTDAEIMEMGNRWDPQPFHIDPEAAKNSVFGGLVASSVHVFAMWVAVGMKANKKSKSAALSALGFDKMRMRDAIRPGDLLRSRSTVKDMRLSSSRPHCGIVTMANEMFNQDDKVVFSIEHTFLIKCKSYDAEVGGECTPSAPVGLN